MLQSSTQYYWFLRFYSQRRRELYTKDLLLLLLVGIHIHIFTSQYILLLSFGWWCCLLDSCRSSSSHHMHTCVGWWFFFIIISRRGRVFVVVVDFFFLYFLIYKHIFKYYSCFNVFQSRWRVNKKIQIYRQRAHEFCVWNKFYCKVRTFM